MMMSVLVMMTRYTVTQLNIDCPSFLCCNFSLYDVQFKSYVDIRFSPEMQDGPHDGRQNEAMGQYFEMGTFKFTFL